MAMLKGLVLVKQIGCQNVVIESDSLELVQACNGTIEIWSGGVGGQGSAYTALLVSLRGSTPADVSRWAGPIRLSFFFFFCFLFCKSGNMFKLDFVLIQISCSNLKICLNSNLFKFEFVQTRICSN
jgi:hypothetical protein